MKELTQYDILKYFDIINEKLKRKNKYGKIVIAGGAALSIVYNARQSTHDIDALFSPSKEFREIILEIALENELDNDWLNDGIKVFLTINLKQTYIKNTVILMFIVLMRKDYLH